MIMTRGIRNNNPFNIKKSNNKWLGKKAVSSDPVFEQFYDLEHGVRAGIVLLRRYVKRYHLTSVNDILKRFAPEVENDLNSYIRFVKDCGDPLYCPNIITYPSYSFNLMCSRMLFFESKLDYHPSDIVNLIEKYNL